MDGFGLERLGVEQKSAIEQTSHKISQLDKYKDDYEQLQSCLHTLPERVTHNIMVPFGYHAFMPGKLVHTNEILVLLGDNWFVQQSAKQAEGIVKRRIQGIERQVEQLRSQQGLLQPRADFLQQLKKEQEDVVEIKEEFREEEEELWRREHRKRVLAYRQQLKAWHQAGIQEKGLTPDIDLQDEAATDERLWARLRELEIQERLGNEYSKITESGPSKGVWWKDDESALTVTSEEEEDGSDGEETDSDDEAPALHFPANIQFSHSSSPPEVQGSSSGKTDMIQNPADVYKLIQPKPILKKSLAATGVDSKHRAEEHRSTDRPKAFCGEVRERNPLYTPTANPSIQSAVDARPLSRFKQQQKKTGR